jgi:MtrB/PioB family decaheme-associated outer membrane protein
MNIRKLENVMKAPYGKMKMGVLAAAVQGAVLAMGSMSACAADPDVADLTTPDNFVEIGAANLSHDSNKFGEYSGMNDKGAYAIGNFSVKGGDGYGPGEGTTRWSVTGSNLGLDSRELKGSISKQGQWNLGIGYDELQHNTTSRYQTPYLGSMGGSNFTLPAGFGTVANPNIMTPAQLSAFHTVDVNNTRKNTSFNAGYIFSPEWKATFDYNNLKQDGAKLMGFSSDGSIGATGERVSILPNPTNYTTETVTIALDWTGDKSYLTVGYFGSFFRNHDDRVTWTTWGALGNFTDTMSVPPDNKLHQFNLSGGYKFSPTTKLTGGFSYGRNTQDDSYVASAASIVSIPRTSLNGEVITTHADLKLVDQTTKDLKLSGSVIYNKRDNQTNSENYNTKHLGNAAVLLPFTTISFDKTQVELAADYRLGKNNKIRVAYNHDDINRYCNNFADSTAFPAGTECVVNTQTKEDTLSLAYKLKAAEGVDFSATYAYSDRNTDYDPLARFPMRVSADKGGVLPSGVRIATIGGLNGGDYRGFHPLYDASRVQNMLKLGVNWEANDKLSLGVKGRYADDNYTENTFGAQDGKSWNVNLDATYNYAEDGSAFGYVSQDYRDRYIKHSARTTPTAGYWWGDQLEDKATTYGLGFKQGGLLGGNLDIKGDLTYSDAKTSYSSDFLAYFGGATTAVSCALPTALTCGSAPDVKNKLTQFKLSGTYKVDKQSKVAVGYLYQRLETHDYYYNAYQYGVTSTSVMPTNQNSGDYSVNVVAVSYIYSFK